MNGCEDIRELLSAGLDGELSAAEAARLEAHLASCEACRRERDALERVWNGLGVLGDVKTPEGMTERVLARVASIRTHRRPRAFLRRWVYPLATAAAVLLAFVIGRLLWVDGELDPQTQQIVRNIDLFENLDVLRDLDMIEKMGDQVILLSTDESNGNSSGGGS
ncbi:MAG TPA: anti-sigma factor [Planctomycetota bacterium]|nr:anti-sigma factor [Planctomycetota bacterium]